MPYTSPENINGSAITGILYYVNEVTSSWISNLILIGLYLILLISYWRARDDLGGAFAVAGFSTFVVALLFFLADFISGIILAIWIALAIVGFVIVAFDKQRGIA